MNFTARTWASIAALAIFVGLPLLFYGLGDVPRRSVLKEGLSILTLLALSMMLGQFFLARSNALAMSLFKPLQIQSVHKYIGYCALAVILVHPALIVLPRYFEGGVRPWDAFVTMLTTFDSLGILLGLAAWLLLPVLAVTAYFRKPLMKRFAQRYRGWRSFHGGLAVAFAALGLWHAIELGRHTGVAMSVLFGALGLTGFTLLAQLYRGARPGTSTARVIKGARS